jgi:FRG domain
MTDVRVSSWSELNEALYEGSWRKQIERFRSPFAFRGVSDASHDLRTTLSRLGAQACELEGHILRNFRKYAPREAVPGDSIWNWLAVAQHHGLPTRLLDWTYSPYVALHFATEQLEHFDRDAVVWCINYIRANEFLPDALRTILDAEGSQAFTAEMLTRTAKSLRELDALSPQPFLVFFEPPSLDERIVNQFALFSLLSDPLMPLERWLDRHPEVVRRVLIPSSLKWEVRDKLDQANITERVLYPGLDGLGMWLRRYYNPRRKSAGLEP